jgi:hypothetical protein
MFIGRYADDLPPLLEGQLLAVLPIEFPPGLIHRALGVEDQTVKIENQTANHRISIIPCDDEGLRTEPSIYHYSYGEETLPNE